MSANDFMQIQTQDSEIVMHGNLLMCRYSFCTTENLYKGSFIVMSPNGDIFQYNISKQEDGVLRQLTKIMLSSRDDEDPDGDRRSPPSLLLEFEEYFPSGKKMATIYDDPQDPLAIQYKEFYESGALKSQCKLNRFFIVSFFLQEHPSQPLYASAEKIFFPNIIGTYTTFYESGNIKHVRQPNGAYEEFYENGKTKKISNEEHTVFYDIQGNIFLRMYQVNGVSITDDHAGTHIEYYDKLNNVFVSLQEIPKLLPVPPLSKIFYKYVPYPVDFSRYFIKSINTPEIQAYFDSNGFLTEFVVPG